MALEQFSLILHLLHICISVDFVCKTATFSKFNNITFSSPIFEFFFQFIVGGGGNHTPPPIFLPCKPRPLQEVNNCRMEYCLGQLGKFGSFHFFTEKAKGRR